MHKLILSGQTLKMVGSKREIASDSIQQVLFSVESTEDWQGFTLVAQFTQAYETTDVLVKNNQFHLPPEIRYGEFSISIHGENGTVQRNTTIPLNLFCNKSGYTCHGKNTQEPTPSLYRQLIAGINRTEQSVNEKAKQLEELAFKTGTVKSVNNIQPDDNGNVQLPPPTADEALEILAEMDIVQPLANENNAVFTDENGKIYIL